MAGSHALITGASAGIGAALARCYHAAGYRITVVARREDALRALASELGNDVHVVAADLNADPDGWLAEVETHQGPVDVLVNNAGVQVIAPSDRIDLEAAERSLHLNLTVPLRLARRLLPGMRERGGGHVVNIASMAALAPVPGMAWYNASKAGLAAASESLAGELRGSGIEVLTVYPGIIDDTAMGRDGMARYQGEGAWVIGLQPMGSADALAHEVLRAMEAGRRRLIWPRSNALARHFPQVTRWLLDRFTPGLRADDQ